MSLVFFELIQKRKLSRNWVINLMRKTGQVQEHYERERGVREEATVRVGSA